jgi:hypothetical protein
MQKTPEKMKMSAMLVFGGAIVVVGGRGRVDCLLTTEILLLAVG